MRSPVVLLALLAGCASGPQAPSLGPGEIPSATDALGFLNDGLTRDEVRGLLGDPGAAVPFDSGYEIWVYRQQLRPKEEPPRRELVLLFSPSGNLAKKRVR